MLILKLILSFNVLITLLNIRVAKQLNQFESFALNLLFVGSLYAVAITSFYTIYTLTLFGVIGLYAYLGFELTLPAKEKLFGVAFGFNAIWLLLFLLYYRDSGLSVFHEDYIVYTRIGFYNDITGVENLQGYYNILGVGKPIEIYHFFELWLMNLGNWVNGVGRPFNLILFSYPLFGGLVILGFRELFPDVSWSIAIGLACATIMVICPYDFLIETFDLPMPIIGVGEIFFYLKNMVVLPVVLYLIIGLCHDRLDYFIVCLLSLFYPVIIPVVVGTLILHHLIWHRFRQWQRLLIPSLLAVIFIALGTFSGLSSWSGIKMNFESVVAAMKIGFSGFVSPVIFFGPILYILLRTKDGIAGNRIMTFFLISNGIALSIWFLLKENVDANQFFRNIFSSFYAITTALCLYLLFRKRKWMTIVPLTLLYLAPAIYAYDRGRIIEPSQDQRSIAEKLPRGARVLYIPPSSEISSIYRYNERLYVGVNPLFLLAENIHIVNTAASLPVLFEANDLGKKIMIAHYRNISPFYKACGEMTSEKKECLLTFAERAQMSYLLLPKENRLFDSFDIFWEGNDLKLLTLPKHE